MINTTPQIDFKARVESLEQNRRQILNALDMALTLCDFQEEIKQRFSPEQLFIETQKRIERVLQFELYAFYFVDQESADFILSICEPDSFRNYVEGELEFMIDNGLIAWALREKKGITVAAQDQKRQLFVHPIATQSRTRGLYIGLFPVDQKRISEVSLNLLSIILRNSANALESTEHYECILKSKKLNESKKRIEAILHSLPIGILVTEPFNLTIIDANPHALSMIELPQEKIVGKKCQEFLHTEEDIRSDQEVSVSEGVLLTARGDRVPVYNTAIPAILGAQKCFIESFLDISEKKRVEQEKMLKEKLQGIVELAGAVCHELNQPLQVISGNSEFALMDMQSDHPLYNIINDIYNQSVKMGAITKKLMNVTRYRTKSYLDGKIIDIDQSSE
jgi:PAS domain-containing protein